MNAPQSFLDGRVLLYLGDCIEQLDAMEAGSVDCVVTSPPYWGLRDYGVDGQIGLEPTLGEHLDVMVRVFEAVRRVLKPTGTLWINYGDCYATSPNGRSAADTKATGNDDRTFRDKPFSTIGGVLKAKDLCMVPNRLAIALQEAGWWVRSEIVWAKPNPMPESIRDRPATSHEKIFMLTKSARYWYDAEAVRQPSAETSLGRWSQDVESQEGSHRANGGTKTNGTMKAVGGPRKKQAQTAASAGAVGASSGRRMAGFNDRWDAKEKLRAADVAAPPRHAGHINHTKLDYTQRGFGRNLRNYEPAPVAVWNIATQPFSDAHFATFPPELAERCILAGCPKGGLVLDPFGGAGTTALVALRHNRRAALIELNPEYAEIARRRIESEWRVQPKQVQPIDAGPRLPNRQGGGESRLGFQDDWLDAHGLSASPVRTFRPSGVKCASLISRRRYRLRRPISTASCSAMSSRRAWSQPRATNRPKKTNCSSVSASVLAMLVLQCGAAGIDQCCGVGPDSGAAIVRRSALIPTLAMR